jgi:hypothetical protein
MGRHIFERTVSIFTWKATENSVSKADRYLLNAKLKDYRFPNLLSEVGIAGLDYMIVSL